MKTIIEGFRHFQEQDSAAAPETDIDAYRIIGLLVIAKRLKRQKSDILSDIRAIEGITTVSVESQRKTTTLDFSEIMIKIDTTPFSGDAKQGIANVQREISQVKGVQSFKIVSKPASI